MRKLRIIEHLSLDGVTRHSAADGDFLYSDQTSPYRTPAGRDAVMAAYGENFDLLLGRRTLSRTPDHFSQASATPMNPGTR